VATFSGYLYLNRGSYFHAASIEQLNYTTCDHNVHEILSKTFKYLQVQHIDNITLLGMSFAMVYIAGKRSMYQNTFNSKKYTNCAVYLHLILLLWNAYIENIWRNHLYHMDKYTTFMCYTNQQLKQLNSRQNSNTERC